MELNVNTWRFKWRLALLYSIYRYCLLFYPENQFPFSLYLRFLSHDPISTAHSQPIFCFCIKKSRFLHIGKIPCSDNCLCRHPREPFMIIPPVPPRWHTIHRPLQSLRYESLPRGSPPIPFPLFLPEYRKK